MDKSLSEKTYWESFSYGRVLPCIELRDFISHFWFSRLNAGVQKNLVYHSTASTNTELVFAFAGNARGQVLVFSSAQGHTEKHRSVHTGGFSEMFGVSIYSYAVPFFFDASAFEFANQLIDVGDIITTNISATINRMECNCDFNQRVKIMTDFLKKRFNQTRKRDLAIINAIKVIKHRQGHVSISTIANEFSLSQKQFERRFKEFSGFNPKLYSSILRFESSLQHHNNLSSLTDIALDLGYYDQAHFIHDFKKFSGFSPGKYTPLS